MEKEQIVKALECCTRGRKSKDDRPCFECPYNECNLVGGTGERQISGTCQGWLMIDALSLIRELIEENERLRASSVDYRNIPYFVADAKADTVRKMQERLKANKVCRDGLSFKVVDFDTIDQIAKEMLDGYAEPFGIMDKVKERMEQDTCVACGDSVPEGRQVCPKCEVIDNEL